MVATGAAFGADAYVCVLKCKQAELDALIGVPTDRFVPLLEVPGSVKATAISRRWAIGEAIWIQPINLDGDDDADFANDTVVLFDELRRTSIAAAPVALLDETPESAAAIAAVVATDGRGIVLRLDAEDLVVASPSTIRSDVDAFLARYGVTPAESDVVLDGSLVRDSVASRVATIESALASLPHLTAWRNLVVALSAFPEDVGSLVGKNAVRSFAREDRAAYLTLLGRGPVRHPAYADFAVGQPTYGGVPFAPIPNIKYTDIGEWHVHRGDSRSNPSPQYVRLASDVSAAAYYRGMRFSRGDQYIGEVATGCDGPGNATTYLRAAMAHHIQHVLDRFATHGEP